MLNMLSSKSGSGSFFFSGSAPAYSAPALENPLDAAAGDSGMTISPEPVRTRSISC